MAEATDKLNLIKNPSLLDGRTSPRGWRWIGDDEAVRWSRDASVNGDDPVLTLQARNGEGTGGWARRVRCKPDEHYRIEVVVSCDCRPLDDESGLVIGIQPLDGGEPCNDPVEMVAPPRLTRPTRLRAYYHSPEDIRSVEIQVGLARATGWACIHEVMMFSIIEPEARSHVLSCPPPPYAYPPPKQVKTVCVCAEDVDRPIVGLLRKRYGTTAVTTVSPGNFNVRTLNADAVMFLDHLPRSLSTLPALEKLAADRIVVVSLPAFAVVNSSTCQVRTIKQPDDPMHAKVTLANFITRGFALADIFPYDWRGPNPTGFAQRQFRPTRVFKEFCERNEYQVVLKSMCNTDAGSENAICLFKQTEAGGLVVLDVEPAEATPTNFDEPDLAFYLLQNVFGADQNTLGQYVSPARSEKELRDEIVELGQRYRALTIHGDTHPEHRRRDQFVELGAQQRTYGLPVSPRPLILIRSGLRGHDRDGIYGTLIWMRNLVHHQPHGCPYALELISRFRLAWVPLGAAYHPDQGWQPPRDAVEYEMAVDVEGDTLAAVIDVTTAPIRRLRVAVSDEPTRERFAELLPGLSRRFLNNRFYYRSVPAGRAVRDIAAADWRFQTFDPQVVGDEEGRFGGDFHRSAAKAGATLIRLEVPACPGYMTTGSIWRTDLVAQTLEHVVGLLYGWIAMNRQTQPLRINPPSLRNGSPARIIRMEGCEPVETIVQAKPGKPVSIRQADALCIADA